MVAKFFDCCTRETPAIGTPRQCPNIHTSNSTPLWIITPNLWITFSRSKVSMNSEHNKSSYVVSHIWGHSFRLATCHCGDKDGSTSSPVALKGATWGTSWLIVPATSILSHSLLSHAAISARKNLLLISVHTDEMLANCGITRSFRKLKAGHWPISKPFCLSLAVKSVCHLKTCFIHWTALTFDLNFFIKLINFAREKYNRVNCQELLVQHRKLSCLHS